MKEYLNVYFGDFIFYDTIATHSSKNPSFHTVLISRITYELSKKFTQKNFRQKAKTCPSPKKIGFRASII
jgi:hypothetical protein